MGDDTAMNRKKQKREEYLTGIAIGLIIGILFFSKLTFGAPIEPTAQYKNCDVSIK